MKSPHEDGFDGSAGRSHLAGAVVSVGIIAIGLLLLLDNLGIVRGRDFWDYAPALVIAFGVLRVVDARGRPGGSITGGLIAAAGGVWLLDNFGIIHFNPGMIWPLILVGVGVSMLVRTLDRHPSASGIAARSTLSDDHIITMFSMFGGSKRVLASNDFRGGDLVGIFGGVELDLRDATITAEQAVVDVTCIFGGAELKVPGNWTVVNKCVAIFGGCEDKTNHPASGPRLVITGSAVFGGISIKN